MPPMRPPPSSTSRPPRRHLPRRLPISVVEKVMVRAVARAVAVREEATEGAAKVVVVREAVARVVVARVVAKAAARAMVVMEAAVKVAVVMEAVECTSAMTRVVAMTRHRRTRPAPRRTRSVWLSPSPRAATILEKISRRPRSWPCASCPRTQPAIMVVVEPSAMATGILRSRTSLDAIFGTVATCRPLGRRRSLLGPSAIPLTCALARHPRLRALHGHRRLHRPLLLHHHPCRRRHLHHIRPQHSEPARVSR